MDAAELQAIPQTRKRPEAIKLFKKPLVLLDSLEYDQLTAAQSVAPVLRRIWSIAILILANLEKNVSV